MKSIIIGNGVTIQFGGKEYLNDRIIKRAVNKIDKNDFPSEIYPKEVRKWLILLHERLPAIVEGNYDIFANTSEMRQSLRYLKKRYKYKTNKLKIHDIGFEDYFLINLLVCNKEKVVNPDKFNITQSLRCFFIDSIYDNGKIQNIYHKYPVDFVDFLKSHNNIFTTNYDNNVEKASNKVVEYLHGSFETIADVYNPDSFRNKLSDRPIHKTTIIEGFDHLYSTALTSYSGESKEFNLQMGISANEASEKFVKGIKENPELMIQIEPWKNDDNYLVRNLYESIILKLNDESLRFQENRSLEKLKVQPGDIVFLGLSPFNDNHIFEAINNNKVLGNITYYFYDKLEINGVNDGVKNHTVEYRDVSELWMEFIV